MLFQNRSSNVSNLRAIHIILIVYSLRGRHQRAMFADTYPVRDSCKFISAISLSNSKKESTKWNKKGNRIKQKQN